MKRSNFLAIITGILLAPFGLKAKPDWTIFKHDPSLVGEKFFSLFITLEKGTTPPKILYRDPTIEIKCPPIPDDGTEHQVTCHISKGVIKYFVDGRRIKSL